MRPASATAITFCFTLSISKVPGLQVCQLSDYQRAGRASRAGCMMGWTHGGVAPLRYPLRTGLCGCSSYFGAQNFTDSGRICTSNRYMRPLSSSAPAPFLRFGLLALLLVIGASAGPRGLFAQEAPSP